MVDAERVQQIALAARIRGLTQSEAVDLRSCGFKPALAAEHHEVLERLEDLGISYASSRSGSDTSPLRTSPTSIARRCSSTTRASLRGMPIAEDDDPSERRQSRSVSSTRRHAPSPREKSASRSFAKPPTQPDNDVDRRPKRLNPPRAHTTVERSNSSACPVKITRSKSVSPQDTCRGRSDSLDPLEEALVSCRDPGEYKVMREQLLKHFMTEDELRRRHDALKMNYPKISYRPTICKKEKKQQAHAHPEPLRKLTEAEIMRMVPSPRGKECVRELRRRRECKKWRDSHLAPDINWRPGRTRPVDLDDLGLSPYDPIPEEYQDEARRRAEEIQRAMQETTISETRSSRPAKRFSSRSSGKSRPFSHGTDKARAKQHHNKGDSSSL